MSAPGRVQILPAEHTGNGALNPVTGLQFADAIGVGAEGAAPSRPPHAARKRAARIHVRFTMTVMLAHTVTSRRHCLSARPVGTSARRHRRCMTSVMAGRETWHWRANSLCGRLLVCMPVSCARYSSQFAPSLSPVGDDQGLEGFHIRFAECVDWLSENREFYGAGRVRTRESMNSAIHMQTPAAEVSHRDIEPGLLPLFRMFVALMLGLLTLRLWLTTAFDADFLSLPSAWPGIVLQALLLGYLFSARLQRWFGRYYLPLAIGLFVTLALVGAVAAMKLRVAAGQSAEELVRGTWMLIVMLVVPLVLVSWQYGFRWAVAYCVITAVIDVAFMLPLTQRGGLSLQSLGAIAFVRTVVLLPVGYTVARIVDVQRRQRAALAEANARLARYATTLENIAAERERHRLAHELHDTLAHGLSSIAVQLEAMLALWSTKPDTVRTMLCEALTATRTALSDSRRAIKALRARPLEDMGLAPALRYLAESTAAHVSLDLSMELPMAVEGLESETEHAIYRIASEAVANVVRHAHARRLTFTMTDDGRNVQLTITDDGRGFDMARPTDEGSFGLYGMQERARLIGAELFIESAPENGTTLRLSVRRDH